jgi:hypothetical protein
MAHNRMNTICCGGGGNEFMVAKRQITPTPESLTEGLPPLPAQKPGEYLTPRESITAYKLGKGRGVWLKSGSFALTPGTGFTYRGLTEYEYWMLAIGKVRLRVEARLRRLRRWVAAAERRRAHALAATA